MKKRFLKEKIDFLETSLHDMEEYAEERISYWMSFSTKLMSKVSDLEKQISEIESRYRLLRGVVHDGWTETEVDLRREIDLLQKELARYKTVVKIVK